MTLGSGAALGPYEILGPLGAGGMGVVYKARDTRLHRTVAIKVLPPHVSADPEARHRFEREARTIASLNHPHICVLHDVGRERPTGAGTEAMSGAPLDFLVLEHLEGRTLADRLAAGPLPVDEALTVALQIADALDKAHRSGIVHRDLKPGNIFLAAGGGMTAKLLDFGLARPAAPLLTTDPGQTGASGPTGQMTLAAPITAAGSILGTIQYMAPEQIESQDVDARTDIFAFGCVLYEMLTGQPAFPRGSPASMMAAILTTTPPEASAVVPVSPRLDHVIRRCLEKNPARRWQSIRDVALELESAANPQDPLSLALTRVAPAAPASAARERRWVVPTAALLALATVAAAAALYLLAQPAAERPRVQFHVPAGGIAAFMSVSPDGRTIAYAAPAPDGSPGLWVRPLDALEPRLVPGPSGNPDWSPDSQSLVFPASDGTLKRVAVAGGVPQTIATLRPGGYQRATWNRQGDIVFSNGGALYRVSASGGEAVQISTPDTSLGESSHATPWFLPDGRRFLYTAWGPIAEARALYVGSLDTAAGDDGGGAADAKAARVRLMPAESKAVYVEPGYLLFLRERTLMARPFDADRLEFTGEPRPLADDVVHNPASGAAAFSASGTTVIYRAAEAVTAPGESREWRWIDRASGQAGDPVGAPHGDMHVALSRDGSRLAFVSSTGDNQDIWIHEIARGLRTRLTADPAIETLPLWSPDGGRVVFLSNRATAGAGAESRGARGSATRGAGWTWFQKPASGAVAEQPLLSLEPGVEMLPGDWSADARTIVAVRAAAPAAAGTPADVDLWVVPADGGSASRYLTTPFIEVHPALSPNGQWLAYVTTESGTAQVVVQPFPDPSGGKWQISTDGGMAPRWRRDGRELYYLDRIGRLVSVPVVTDGRFELGTPLPLFETPFPVPGPGALNARVPYDASADGQTFLFSLPIDRQVPDAPITVVMNWLSAER